MNEDYEINNGEKYFGIEELEVFQIIIEQKLLQYKYVINIINKNKNNKKKLFVIIHQLLKNKNIFQGKYKLFIYFSFIL